jgi:hypothetical protein
MPTITTHWRKIVLTNEKGTAVVKVFYYIRIRYWYYYHSVNGRDVGGRVNSIILCNSKQCLKIDTKDIR